MRDPNKVIFYIDDEEANLITFELAFKSEYTIYTFLSGLEALAALEEISEVPIILTDQRMPEMTGIELLEKTISICPECVRIILTAYTEKEDFLDAINNGKVSNYIVKPWNYSQVKKILDDSFEKYFLYKKNKELIEELQDKNRVLQETINHLKEVQAQLIHHEKSSIIGDLTSGLAHEIKNLLNPISYLELFDTPLKAEERQFINFIYESRNQIVNIIDEVRALARNEEIEYKKNEINLKSIIDDSLNIIKMDSTLRNRKINIDILPEINVFVNKNKIIQVLLNLLKNAAHAIETKKDGEIWIKNSKNCQYAEISVIDNGIGIEKSKLDKIWEPFFTTKGEKGTGIGLDIVKRIIQGHNGYIYCDSIPGRTAFTFTLPMINNEDISLEKIEKLSGLKKRL